MFNKNMIDYSLMVVMGLTIANYLCNNEYDLMHPFYRNKVYQMFKNNK
jgi:hypothetical protein